MKCSAFRHIRTLHSHELVCVRCLFLVKHRENGVWIEKDLTAIPLTNYYNVHKHSDSTFGWLYTAYQHVVSLKRKKGKTGDFIHFKCIAIHRHVLLVIYENICCYKVKHAAWIWWWQRLFLFCKKGMVSLLYNVMILWSSFVFGILTHLCVHTGSFYSRIKIQNS